MQVLNLKRKHIYSQHEFIVTTKLLSPYSGNVKKNRSEIKVLTKDQMLFFIFGTVICNGCNMVVSWLCTNVVS